MHSAHQNHLARRPQAIVLSRNVGGPRQDGMRDLIVSRHLRSPIPRPACPATPRQRQRFRPQTKESRRIETELELTQPLAGKGGEEARIVRPSGLAMGGSTREPFAARQDP